MTIKYSLRIKEYFNNSNYSTIKKIPCNDYRYKTLIIKIVIEILRIRQYRRVETSESHGNEINLEKITSLVKDWEKKYSIVLGLDNLLSVLNIVSDILCLCNFIKLSSQFWEQKLIIHNLKRKYLAQIII